jgi:hypothetical protein
VVNGAIYALPYDTLKDFEPISPISSQPYMVIARQTLPSNDLKGFIAWLKVNPDKASAGTSGVVSPGHIAGLFFQETTGTRFQFVPYRGGALMMQDLAAGQIDLSVASMGDSVGQVRATNVKAFALTDRERGQETEQANPHRTEHIASCQARTSGVRQLEQSLPHHFQLARRQDRRQQRRQRFRDDASCDPNIGRLAHRTQLHDVAPLFVEASHQKHSCVNDPPGQVAAERGEKHGPNLDAVRRDDAERTGEGQGHYQAEQDLRYPVHRIEDSIGQSGRKRRHRIDRHLDWLVTPGNVRRCKKNHA